MQIPIGQMLNPPDVQVLSVEITEREIKCDIESTLCLADTLGAKSTGINSNIRAKPDWAKSRCSKGARCCHFGLFRRVWSDLCGYRAFAD
jgi:hypothetical protein